jgi:uncharacterized protein YuzE
MTTEQLVIHTVISDSKGGTDISAFPTHDQAYDAFYKAVKEKWDEEFPDEDFPDDLDKARETLSEFDHSYWWLEEASIELPPRYALFKASLDLISTPLLEADTLDRLKQVVLGGKEVLDNPDPAIPDFPFEVTGKMDDSTPVDVSIKGHISADMAIKIFQAANHVQTSETYSCLIDALDISCQEIEDDKRQIYLCASRIEVFSDTFIFHGEEHESFAQILSDEMSIYPVLAHFEIHYP